MAFTPITSAQIEVGQPTKKELFLKSKDNFDDHEARILSNESAAVKTFPIKFQIIDSGAVLDDADQWEVINNITITGVSLRVFTAGTAGTMEIDVQAKLGASPFTTVLGAGNLQLAFGAGDNAKVSSSSLAVTDIDAGDTLRLDIKTTQTEARNYEVVITYTLR